MQEILQCIIGMLSRVGLWVIVFTRPAHDSMLAVCVLVLADLIAGVMASRKRGERITSYGLRQTITRKIVPYFIAIMCAHLFEQQFLPGIPLMKAIAGFCALAELKSIFENLGELTGLDLWNAIRERLQPMNREPHDQRPQDKADEPPKAP